MPEDLNKAAAEARAEAVAPTQEAESSSVEELRNKLLTDAGDSVEGLKDILKMLDRSNFSKEALAIRDEAGDKLEELKSHFDNLLSQKVSGELSGEAKEVTPKIITDTAEPSGKPVLGPDGKPAVTEEIIEGTNAMDRVSGEEEEKGEIGEEFTVVGRTFHEGQIINYTTIGGKEGTYKIVGPSKFKIPGLILQDTADSNLEFAISGKKVKEAIDAGLLDAGEESVVEDSVEAEENNFEELITNANTWDELIAVVDEIGEFESSAGTLTANHLNERIKLLRDQEAAGTPFTSSAPIMQEITRTHGLRDKVVELLDKASEESAEESVEEASEESAPVVEEKEEDLDSLKERQASFVSMMRQIEEALSYIDGGKESVAKGHDLIKTALEESASLLGREEEIASIIKDKRKGTPAYRKALEDLYSQISSEEKEVSEKVVEQGEAEEDSQENQEQQEKIKQIRALIQQAEAALKYKDGGQKEVADRHTLIKEALAAANELLEDEDIESLLNRPNATEKYEEALEEVIARLEELLRAAERGEEEGEPGEETPEEEEDGEGEAEDGEDTPEEDGEDGEDGEDTPEDDGEGGGEGEPTAFELSTNNYADAKAKLFKGYGGILGVLKRLNRKGYKEAQLNLEDARAAYELERAKLIAENINNYVTAEQALADATRDRMSEQKRIPGISWAYDQWRKLGKARMAASLGLLGLGIAAGSLGAGVAVAGGIFVGRKILTLGGLSTSFATYEGLTNLSYKGVGKRNIIKGGAPKIELSEERSEEMKEWEANYKRNHPNLPGAGRRMLGVFKSLSPEQQQEYKEYMDRKAEKEKELNTDQLAEGGAEQMPDDELDKAISYYASETPFRGYKPSEDPAYVALLREKARRMKGALEMVDSEEDARKAEAQGQIDRLIENKKQEKINEQLQSVKDWLKYRYLVSQKYDTELTALTFEGGTAEEQQEARRNSEQYQRWEDAKNKMHELQESFPAEIDALIAATEDMDQGKMAGLYKLIGQDDVESLAGITGEEISADGVWAADWELNSELQEKIDEFVRGNETLMAEAEAEARNEAEAFIDAVEESETRREERKESVMILLNEGLNDIDLQIEDRTKTAVRRDAYRKLVAAAAGVTLGMIMSADSAEPGPDPDGGDGVSPEPEPGPGPDPDGGDGVSPEPEPGPGPDPDGGDGGSPEPGPDPDGGDGGSPEPGPGPDPDEGAGWTDPEPVEPGELGEPLEGTFERGNGVIHVMRRLSEQNPELFEGMSDSEMQRTVLRQLMDTTLEDGRPALVWDAEQGWGYNHVFHPGDKLSVITDADGKFVGFETEDFRPRGATRWRPFGGVRPEEVMQEAVEGDAAVVEGAPEEVGDNVAPPDNETLEKMRDNVLPEETGENIAPPDNDSLEKAADNPIPGEGYEPGSPDTVNADFAEGDFVEQGGIKFSEHISAEHRDYIVRSIGMDRSTLDQASAKLAEYQSEYGSRPNWNQFNREIQREMSAVTQRMAQTISAVQSPDYQGSGTIRSFGGMTPEAAASQRVEAMFAQANSRVRLIDAREAAQEAFDRL